MDRSLLLHSTNCRTLPRTSASRTQDSIFDVMEYWALDTSNVFSVECLIGTSFVINSIITFSLPILCALAIAVFWVAFAVAKGMGSLDPWITARARLSILVTLVTLYPTMTKGVFEFFHCSEDIEGKRLLRADSSIFCYEPSHLLMIGGLAMPAGVLYVIGIPVSIVFTLWMNRNNLAEEHTRVTLGFIYSNYTLNAFLWEAVVMAR